MTEDITLVNQAQSWDKWALEELIRKNLQGIYSVCFRICQDEQDAHDITQNVCIKIINWLAKFKNESLFKTWIYRIAYNEALDHLRKQKYHEDITVIENTVGTTDNLDIDEEYRNKVINWALKELPEIDRSLILFFYFDELRINQIAEITHLNENTIKTRLSRAKKLLSVKLDPLWIHY